MTEDRNDTDQAAFWGAAGIVVMAIFGLGILAVVLFLSSKPAPAGPLWRSGQSAQIDPSDREFLRTQKVPGQTYRCCDESDGTYAEEDLRDGHYWVRFNWRHPDGQGNPTSWIATDWMQVPDEAVIHDANRHGAPVVWWMWVSGFGDEAKVGIRCFAPGALF